MKRQRDLRLGPNRFPQGEVRGEYGLICSLGGNRSAAHNLQIRGLRSFSLPFDWLFVVDDRPIWYLSERFKTCFERFCLKENLVELQDPEHGTDHDGRMQYKDIVTGYRFVNHFSRPTEEPGEYERVYVTLRRRIERLYKAIEGTDRILFVLVTGTSIDCADALWVLLSTLRTLWPQKIVDIVQMSFEAGADKMEYRPHPLHFHWKRPQHLYDFLSNAPEWSAFDMVSKG